MKVTSANSTRQPKLDTPALDTPALDGSYPNIKD